MNLVIHILSSTVVPLFVLILLGAALGLKYQINLSSLSKLYFNVFMPGFLFVNLYQAQITREMMWAFLFAALLGAANFALAPPPATGGDSAGQTGTLHQCGDVL